MPDNRDDPSKSNHKPLAPDKFEPIKAADVPLAQGPIQAQAPNQPASTNNTTNSENNGSEKPPQQWIYAAILVALACVILLFIATVYQSDPADTAHSFTEDEPSSSTPQPSNLEESPFEKAQLAAARRSAQDILARVLTKQQALEAGNIQQWANEEYQQALASANAGDQLYREREFKAAIEHFQAAESLLDKLEAAREPHIAQLLSQGLAALNQGQVDLAQQAFEQILLISPDQPQALQGKLRCVSLPKVFAATERGQALQAAGNYASALGQYAQALSLDPLFEPAIAGENEAQRLLLDEQFQTAINQGYQHLHSGELNTARKHFRQALAIKPQSAAAQTALTQVDNEIAQAAIARLLNSAQGDESKEQWQSALDTYNKILSRDAAVTAATVGKIRSAARAQLNTKLENFIHQPLRLASPSVYREAQQSLRNAQQIVQAGPRLKQQIHALSQILVKAQQPQTVLLRSDKLTHVRIFKHGEFAPFIEKTLQLKPGKYIAEGIRDGYRDVRVEFTVLGSGTVPVVVQCRETI